MARPALPMFPLPPAALRARRAAGTLELPAISFGALKIEYR
jgi:hypothetical protein